MPTLSERIEAANRQHAAVLAGILASSTITNNRSTGGTSFGGGLYLYKGISMANTTFRMRNSIVADNLAANAPDCSNNQAVLSSDGFNLFGNQGMIRGLLLGAE